MGTRHLTIIKSAGKLYGNYGQWDGYPEGQGKTCLAFIQTLTPEREREFKAHFASARELTQAKIADRYVEAGAQRGSGLIGGAVSKKFDTLYPHLSRNCGAEILDYIQKTPAPELLPNQIDFAADSLFCEFGWLVDFDERKLVVFRGFNKVPLADGEFFKFLESLPSPAHRTAADRYYPIKHWMTLEFDALSQLTEGDFLARFKEAA